MNTPYVPPAYNYDAFNCPVCKAYSLQHWNELFCTAKSLSAELVDALGIRRKELTGGQILQGFTAAQCSHCLHWSIWQGESMIYPKLSVTPPPVPDTPDNVKADYLEAANVLNESPRAAAALIRLALQKLMPHLGQKGKNLDEDIAELVKDGLPPRIQQALDSLRAIGNNAVHPGKMDITDDHQTALSLFSTLNMVVEQMISRPRQIEELYSKLPPSAVEAIGKRDGK